jgi:hypothetical protein
MILVRDVFQAKYGRGDELVALIEELGEQMEPSYRILTDLSGPYFTVVLESEAESMAQFEEWIAAQFDDPDFGEWFERMVPLVESGRREFYNIESSG